jgi:hypothetical protein
LALCCVVVSAQPASLPQAAQDTPRRKGTPSATASPEGNTKAEVSPQAARAARQAFEAGQRAEREAQWRLAHAQFAEAAQLDPGKAEYAVGRELARFRIAQEHVDRAEAAAVNGQLERAILELRAAMALDPGHGVAAERLRQLEGLAARGARITEDDAGLAPQLRIPAGTRSFNYRGNTRGAYEEIARQFELTSTFDDGIRIKTVEFRLSDVDLPTALHALARQTGTFWIATGERSFFVSDATEQRRRDYEPQVVRTITLPSSATTERMTELLRILRDILDIRRIQLDVRARTLTIRDARATVEMATALIQEIEQPRGELMLEVTVAEVDRANATRLGLLPPSSARVFSVSPEDVRRLQNPQQSFGELAAILQRIFGTSGGSGLGGLVPPLVAFGGGQTVGLATLPGASAEFSQAMSVFRSARRVLLRSEDSHPASFFIGERFPINLAVLSANIGAPLPVGTEGTGPNVIPRQDFPAGDGPSSIITFDLNLDNSLDLVVANQAANTVSVLLGNGDGTFGAPADFPVGLSPAAVAVGDFNADGDLDIVTANEGDDTVTVLFGAGDGTFGAPTAIPVGLLPRGVAVGNLNGDGRVDILVANHGSNTISVLLGSTAGVFTRRDFNVGAGPIALVTADFDGNGLLDAAVANQNSNNVTILLGAGDGTFSSAFNIAVGTGPRGLTSGRMDSDNFTDVVVANEADNTVSVLLGNGDGTFRGAEFTTGNAPTSVVIADFDGSGTTDVITSNFSADTVSLLLGLGDGALGLRADLAAGDGPIDLAAGNFNGDGRLDLAIANQLSDNVTIILNSSTLAPPGGFFPPTTPYPAFQFEELGLKVRATPRMHEPDEVTLQLNIEIRSRASETFNGIPVISNRTLEEAVRLKEGETSVIAGMLQRDETFSLSGTPGLAHLLLPGRVPSKRDRESGETELLLFITPRRLRLAPRTNRTLYAPLATSSMPPTGQPN